MKNRDSLRTGVKPAPGDLVFIQGFVNALDVEAKQEDLSDKKKLKSWLVFHGFIDPSERVSEKDREMMISFREALRSFLLANNGESVEVDAVKQLNELAASVGIVAEFRDNYEADLRPAGRGVKGVLGEMILIVIKAMSDGSWRRLKACRESRCRWAFYDSSKNQSGRWCSMSVCGARTKAREYRKRKAQMSR